MKAQHGGFRKPLMAPALWTALDSKSHSTPYSEFDINDGMYACVCVCFGDRNKMMQLVVEDEIVERAGGRNIDRVKKQEGVCV